MDLEPHRLDLEPLRKLTLETTDPGGLLEIYLHKGLLYPLDLLAGPVVFLANSVGLVESAQLILHGREPLMEVVELPLEIED